jgi:hypothetical protein
LETPKPPNAARKLYSYGNKRQVEIYEYTGYDSEEQKGDALPEIFWL